MVDIVRYAIRWLSKCFFFFFPPSPINVLVYFRGKSHQLRYFFEFFLLWWFSMEEKDIIVEILWTYSSTTNDKIAMPNFWTLYLFNEMSISSRLNLLTQDVISFPCFPYDHEHLCFFFPAVQLAKNFSLFLIRYFL